MERIHDIIYDFDFFFHLLLSEGQGNLFHPYNCFSMLY